MTVSKIIANEEQRSALAAALRNHSHLAVATGVLGRAGIATIVRSPHCADASLDLSGSVSFAPADLEADGIAEITLAGRPPRALKPEKIVALASADLIFADGGAERRDIELPHCADVGIYLVDLRFGDKQLLPLAGRECSIAYFSPSSLGSGVAYPVIRPADEARARLRVRRRFLETLAKQGLPPDRALSAVALSVELRLFGRGAR